LPANFSPTENRVKHFGQVTAIGMGEAKSGEDERRTDAMAERVETTRLEPPAVPAQSELASDTAAWGTAPTGTSPLAHVVLYQPEIPQNTGNIGRTCVATDSQLWIVQPAGFRIDEKRVRRAGLDYWQHLRWAEVPSWENLRQQLPGKRFWYFSRFATQTIWEADFRAGDAIVFGSESSGLPRTIFDPTGADAVRLPTDPRVRSLNLSNTVAVVLYEMLRRRDAAKG
jgi:tRNA (cytidine/uridine-2'-O-)-methyltransferase